MAAVHGLKNATGIGPAERDGVMMTEYTGKWVLVTGASAGIGAAFARAFGAQGANVILTARRADRLDSLAAELRAAHGVETLTIPADLADPMAPQQIADMIVAAGHPVDILVNNAGYGQPGHFEDEEWSVHRDFLEIMVTSYAHLIRLFLPGMQARGWGRIIQVASLAGLAPGSSGHTMYGASKAFLVSFSQSLAAENADKGVNVSALCPGFTYSEFHDVNGTRGLTSKLPRYAFMDSEPVVAGAIEAVERGHVVYVPGNYNKFVAWLMKALPRPWAASVVKRQSARFRKQNT